MGRLTTHILDTVHGGPAAGVGLRLYSLRDAREMIASATTDDNGRTAQPLLDGELFTRGQYELEFDIGAYFQARGTELADPPFLDTVVIRFAVDGVGDYHVPLLASPWSYSTYRGS